MFIVPSTRLSFKSLVLNKVRSIPKETLVSDVSFYHGKTNICFKIGTLGFARSCSVLSSPLTIYSVRNDVKTGPTF